ncbi:MAG: RNA polymerase sigma factor [Coriobacteriales bacterium]|nr:RNA polymerase sigma factor [Coriobacteriales bacterium]
MRNDQDIEYAIDIHGDTVWRICRMRMGQDADAQDAFQETFLKYALNDTTRFNNSEHERAWLIRVATNVCIDLLRSHSHAPEEFDESYEDIPDPVNDSMDANLWEAKDILNILPPDQRQALYLTVYEEMQAADIAEIMGVPIGTVYSWITRAKQKLKEALS